MGILQKNYPLIHFSISELTTDSIITKLNKREIDVGILALPLEEENLLEYHLYNEEFVLFDCFSSHNKDIIELEEINYDQFWLMEEGHCLANQAMKICNLDKRASKRAINFEFKAGSIDSLIRFVKESRGNTFLPYLATIDFSDLDKEKVSSFKKEVPVRNIGIVTHKHFVKKQLLELLQIKIKEKINPLLPSDSESVSKVISPENILMHNPTKQSL